MLSSISYIIENVCRQTSLPLFTTSQAMASSSASQGVTSGDLVNLISSSASATVYPTDDAILNVLHARFRLDLPSTSISTSTLVVVNPYKSLANINEVSAKEYEEKCYKDTSMPLQSGPASLQPHLWRPVTVHNIQVSP